MKETCRLQFFRLVSLNSLLRHVFLAFLMALPASAQLSDSASFQTLAQQAQAARTKGDDAASIQLYRRALDLNPSWQEGWWYYGSLLYDDNQYPQAVTALRRLTVLAPQMGGAWALLGLSEYETHDFSNALKDLQRATALGPGEDQSLANITNYHLAVLLNAEGQSDTARKILSSLLLQGVNSEDLQIALGLSLLRVPILPYQLDPSKDALIHEAGNAAAMMAHKQYEMADATFKDLAEKYPDTSFIHYAYGSMLASNAQDDAAEVQLRKEIQINPKSALAYMELSFLEAKAARFPEAVQLAQEAVRLSGDSFMAHYLLGNALLSMGNAKAAEPQLETARQLAPESPEVRYSLARAYAKLGKSALAKHEEEEFLRIQKKLPASGANGNQDIPNEQ
jgi:tetratricopeptide (TPR) repeat protein